LVKPCRIKAAGSGSHSDRIGSVFLQQGKGVYFPFADVDFFLAGDAIPVKDDRRAACDPAKGFSAGEGIDILYWTNFPI